MSANTKRNFILPRLENLVSKIKLQSRDFSDVDFRVFPPQKEGSPYVIEVSKGRFARRVFVDLRTIQHFHPGHLDPNLVRELRIAMLAVARLARDRR